MVFEKNKKSEQLKTKHFVYTNIHWFICMLFPDGIIPKTKTSSTIS